MSAACFLSPFCVFHKLNAAIKASGCRSIFLSSISFLNNSLPLPPVQLSDSCSVVSPTPEKILETSSDPNTHTGVCTLHLLEGSVQLCKGPQLTHVTWICLISRWMYSFLLLLKQTFLFGNNLFTVPFGLFFYRLLALNPEWVLKQFCHLVVDFEKTHFTKNASFIKFFTKQLDKFFTLITILFRMLTYSNLCCPSVKPVCLKSLIKNWGRNQGGKSTYTHAPPCDQH